MSNTASCELKPKILAEGDFYAEGFECGHRWGSTGSVDRRLALIQSLQSEIGHDYSSFFDTNAEGECFGWVALAVVLGGPHACEEKGPVSFWEAAIGGSETWRGDRIVRGSFLRGFCDGALSSQMNV
jgi:hypothetical protein